MCKSVMDLIGFGMFDKILNYFKDLLRFMGKVNWNLFVYLSSIYESVNCKIVMSILLIDSLKKNTVKL